eukprot:CAMPEP_0179145168 /NCGR_PEP_ID=MMETSP0796-20121207/70011_1 /TAXON_ID=73915 /ORGANISM="Pyrodinium bahamense, Strain pbaha01" /LENGTH=50 /DNA_ID=CAMNT_0020845511 /DNA_START=10 /DNA_END=158 /DNA_ORIENTATION=+
MTWDGRARARTTETSSSCNKNGQENSSVVLGSSCQYNATRKKAGPCGGHA